MRGTVVKAPAAAAAAEVGITELEKFEPTRVDGVKTPANGFPILMMKGIAGSPPGPSAAQEKAQPAVPGDQPEDEHEKALALVKGVLDGSVPVPVLAKDAAGYDESADIAGALEVIRQISMLVCSEATSLGQGRLEEIWDIGTLMDALCAMKYFLINERDQDNGTGIASSTDVNGSAGLDGAISYKQAAKAIADTQQFADAYRALRKTAKRLGITPHMPHDWASGENTSSRAAKSSTSTTDVIKAAVAEALAASQERITTLEADLAKVKATPIPGGPLLVTPLTQRPAVNPAVQKAERLRAIAEQTSDPQVATAYRALAAREEGAPITKD